MNNDVVIVGAARTPVGAFNGAFGSLPAHELGKTAIAEALKRAGVEGGRVSEVIMGQILTAAQGQNPARQASIAAGIPVESPAWGVNQLCGSGLRAVALGYQAILNGDSEIVVAGGQESMSMAPHAAVSALRPEDGLARVRRHDDQGRAVGRVQRLPHGHHRRERRQAVPDHAAASRTSSRSRRRTRPRPRRRPASSRMRSFPITIKSRKGDMVVDTDEYSEHGVDARRDCQAASGVRQGRLGDRRERLGHQRRRSRDRADERRTGCQGRRTPLARIVSWAHAGVDPKIMGTGPIPASRAALKKAGWNVGDLDLIEANEAFAAQACAVNKDLGWDPSKVNVNGGAIAIGHPIGASGARVLTTLLFEMQKRNAKKGLATLCIGGGMGIAMCVER